MLKIKKTSSPPPTSWLSLTPLLVVVVFTLLLFWTISVDALPDSVGGLAGTDATTIPSPFTVTTSNMPSDLPSTMPSDLPSMAPSNMPSPSSVQVDYDETASNERSEATAILIEEEPMGAAAATYSLSPMQALELDVVSSSSTAAGSTRRRFAATTIITNSVYRGVSVSIAVAATLLLGAAEAVDHYHL